jgi:tRNA threonylcarbamoyladenosine biosynthesis protein TsaB
MMEGNYELYGNRLNTRGHGMERILLLDTSARQGQVALAADGAILHTARLEAATRRAGDLAVVVEQLLRNANWRPLDVTRVVVGLGPGSFTGLRVGVASAKAFAYAIGCAFVGVETFAAIAARPVLPAGRLVVLADALQGQVFTRTYLKSPQGLEPCSALRVQSLRECLAELQPNSLVAGPGVSLMGNVPDHCTLAPAQYGEVTPLSLLAASEYAWAMTTDVWRAEPLYLRGSSAEEKRQKDALNAVSRQEP